MFELVYRFDPAKAESHRMPQTSGRGLPAPSRGEP